MSGEGHAQNCKLVYNSSINGHFHSTETFIYLMYTCCKAKREMDGQDSRRREDIFSKPVRAGKRTYFFDVKATRGNDYYLTITESKRRIDENGKFHYDKHKLFLYKEDFEKFADGLTEAIDFIKREKGDDYGAERHESHVAAAPAPVAVETAAETPIEAPVVEESKADSGDGEYSSDISFDDLGDDEKT